MTLKKKLIQNSLWLYTSDILGKVLSYFLIIAIARNLGEVGLGEYSFIFAFASFSLLLSDFGLSYFLMKEVAQDPSSAKKYFPAIFSMRIVFSGIAILAFVALSVHVGKPAHVTTGILIALAIYVITSINDPCLSILQASNRIRQVAIANMLERTVAFAAGLYVLWAYQSLILMIWMLLASNILRQIIIFTSARSLISIRFNFNIRDWMEILPRSVPFWLTGIFTYIYFRTDTIMLSLMVGDQATGVYNAAYKLTETTMFIPSLLVFIIMPSISYSFKHDAAMLRTLVQRALKYLLYIAFPMTVGTIILADRLIAFIYNEQFAASGTALQVLIIAAFFNFINSLLANLLTATDKQNYFVKITMSLAGLNVLLNLFLIPTYLQVGAGVATVITQAFGFVLMGKYADKFILKIDYARIAWKPLVASIVMGLVILRSSALPVWYLVPVGAIVYFTVLLLFGIDKEDRELFKNVF